MPHVFETAVTGRSKCRGCGRALERGELRFGERMPNPFADGETTLWFHPLCAAYKRPEPMLEAFAQSTDTVPNREALERAAHGSLGPERAESRTFCGTGKATGSSRRARAHRRLRCRTT